MTDYIVRATAADNQIRAFAATTRDMVETAREHHETSPVATAALGRLLTAGAMMGSMMKNDTDMLTLQIRADGPLGGITVTADAHGDVKGYVLNPDVMLPPKNGKLDVGGAVGIGLLNVIKDMGLKEPYVGQTILVTSEIAEDLTKYFAESEQIPSAVALGVLVDTDQHVKQAGGYMVQLMPGATDEDITRLEQNIAAAGAFTTMLEKGMSLEDIARTVLDGFELEFLENTPIAYRCGCSHAKVTRALISLGREELTRLRDEEDGIEVTCQFCDKIYKLSKEDIDVLLIAASGDSETDE